jgi:cation diffusion facilitator CzcD-associated flavoprotein CzcO
MSQDRTVSVIVIGAGMSGICMGVKLQDRGIDDFVIIEKSPDVGGTWYDNTYPGACCDVASVLYSYSFEPNPNWSRKYSAHDEIQAYFSHCVDKYGLRDKLRLNTALERADYDDTKGLWTVTLADGERLTAKCLVSGLGQLNRPNIPEFAGAQSFEGTQFHSARWRHDIDLSNKRVAIIGNAASALQFIPKVAEQAEQVYVYQRSANYVVKRGDREYTEQEKARFKRFPLLQKLHRLDVYLRGEAMFYPVMRAKKWAQRMFNKMSKENREEFISDPQLREKLTPDYLVGCKRILVSDDYYQAFARTNVELVTADITGIAPHGVATADDIDRSADVLIYGTGFNASEFLSSAEFYGSAGKSIKEAWVDGAEAYRGVCTAGFPNFFMLYGPNTNLGSNSIIFMVERQVDYIVSCIDKVLSHQLTSLEISETAMRAYNDRMQGELAGTVWVSSCESWYKNDAGKVVNNWPRSTLAYWWHMRSPDFSDYEMR